MIIEGLRVMLFGMIGIFIVVGVIIITTILLNRFGKKDQEEGVD